MSAPAAWTIKSLIQWTTQYLSEKKIDSPRLEAELLLAHALKCKRIDLMVRFHEEPTAAEKAEYKELVRRRAEHWPTAYLIGSREFFLLKFEVNPAVLIPRPDTETLVLTALESLKSKPGSRVLELGTGSGCIAVSLAVKSPQASFVAVDLSPDALELAKKNAAAHNVASRIDFRLGDLFAPVAGEMFDTIVSNPPYVTVAEWQNLAEEVRDHEPRLALDGGPDGLAFYRRIAGDCHQFLHPGGEAIVEIGETQQEAVASLFAANPAMKFEKCLKDGAGRPRVVIARKA
jgi:release factor glutamine methyltransferase